MANFYSVAKTLEEFLKELIDKGMTIPPQVITELKTGRSVTSIHQRMTEETDVETLTEVELKAMIALQNVEMNLLSLADEKFGKDYAEQWQKKVNEAYMDNTKPQVAAAKTPVNIARYATGVPKGEHWIRVQTSWLENVQDLDDKLESRSLSTIPQDDDYLLVYGRKADVSDFLKEIRQIVGKMGS